MHSFTPAWKGVARPWHVTVLWDADPRLPLPLIAALEAEGDLVVGDNEPYDGALAGDTVNRHATARGLSNVLIEVRQDLIATEAGALAWGERLARVIGPILAADPAQHRIELHPTRTASRQRAPSGRSGPEHLTPSSPASTGLRPFSPGLDHGGQLAETARASSFGPAP